MDDNNAYYTDNGNNVGCDSLNNIPYHSNIDINNKYFSHNPELMVYLSQMFMDEATMKKQPFFLYSAEDSLFKNNIINTNIPKNYGMSSRTNIWNKALSLGFTTNNRINSAASDIWIDDSLNALINYMENIGNDAKGTLYEYGSSIIQFVRFPLIFELSGIHNEYKLDVITNDDNNHNNDCCTEWKYIESDANEQYNAINNKSLGSIINYIENKLIEICKAIIITFTVSPTVVNHDDDNNNNTLSDRLIFIIL